MRMPRWMIAWAWLLAMASISFAEEARPMLKVWPGKPPGAAQDIQEKWDKKKVTNVTEPTLEVFRPGKDKDTGVAVIVCPGGGYQAPHDGLRGRRRRPLA